MNKGLGFPDNFMDVLGYKKVKNKIVSIGGAARAGKNSVADIIENWAIENGIKCKIFSFAFLLKEELDQVLIQKYGISAFTEITEEKNVIRLDLIKYGTQKRLESNGTHWWKLVERDINKFFMNGGELSIISDHRFDEYLTDETQYIKNNNGTIVFVEREGIGSAHKSEEDNLPKIKEQANFLINWKSTSDLAARRAYCHEVICFLKKYFEN